MHLPDSTAGAPSGRGLKVGAIAPSWKVAVAAFVVLFAMHMLDFTDRNILYAVQPLLMEPESAGGLGLPVDQVGWLATFYLMSHSGFALLMGRLGDVWRRTWLLGIGVGVWSVATIASGFARSFGGLAASRAVLGIGEATYGVIAPTLLVDLFPRRFRTRVFALFYLAMPVGSAVGMVLGGAIGERAGWRSAFFVVGVPGLILALLAFLLPDPVRGATEDVDEARLRAHERRKPSASDYRDLMVNSSYTYSVLGMAAYSFAIGGLVVWMPTYLNSTRGVPLGRATLLLGGITVVAAILGMLIGGTLCDRLAPKRPGVLFLVPGVAMLGAIPFVLLGLLATNLWAIGIGIFCAELLMFVNTAPCNAIIANVTPPNLRATANAAALASVHLLGDLWSPPLIGWVAKQFGRSDMMATGLGETLAALGAYPVTPEGQSPQNLVAGLLIVVPAIALSGFVFLAGTRHIGREMALMMARLKAEGAG